MCLMKCVGIVYWFVRVFWLCNNFYEVNMQAVSALSNTYCYSVLLLLQLPALFHLLLTWCLLSVNCGWVFFLSIFLPDYSIWPFLLYTPCSLHTTSLLYPERFCRCLIIIILLLLLLERWSTRQTSSAAIFTAQERQEDDMEFVAVSWKNGRLSEMNKLHHYNTC